MQENVMKQLAEIRLFIKMATFVSVMNLGTAAKQDESRGFALTAAWEWRQAAELAMSIPQLANHCWREWERIMHLPRPVACLNC
jgi:hypothetical protein